MDEQRKTRRRHGAQFKSEVLAACRAPGASVAGVALSFGLNANLVRQWLRGRGAKQVQDALVAPSQTLLAHASGQQFVPVKVPAAVAPEAITPAPEIRIEVRRGPLQVNVSWPQSAAADCAGWLRELLR
jgi:transposase